MTCTTPSVKRKNALYDENKEFTRYIENDGTSQSLRISPKYNERYLRMSIRYDDSLKVSSGKNISKKDYRVNDKLNVKYFGAIGDGITNDTDVIQFVLNLAKETGEIVYLPVGKYLIDSLEIPENVTLFGENNKTSSDCLGTVLYCQNHEKQAILLNSHSGIKNIAFYYPRQNIVNDYAVTYPASIKLTDKKITTLIDIVNICFINAYFAIDATAKHEKLRINNIWGYAIVKGLYIDGCTDMDMIDGVHFNYNTLRKFYDEKVIEEFELQTSKSGVAFQFGRSDTSIVKNIFAYGYRIGLQLITSVTANKLLPPTYTIFTNVSMDTCDYPLWIGNASHVIFNNFVGVSNNHNGDVSNIKACLYITNGDGIYMSNSILTGYGNLANINADDVIFSCCSFRNFNRGNDDETIFAVETKKGDISINNSVIIGSQNRNTGFLHGFAGANSITVVGCMIKNISLQGKLVQKDNEDTIITQGLNTLINCVNVVT